MHKGISYYRQEAAPWQPHHCAQELPSTLSRNTRGRHQNKSPSFLFLIFRYEKRRLQHSCTHAGKKIWRVVEKKSSCMMILVQIWRMPLSKTAGFDVLRVHPSWINWRRWRWEVGVCFAAVCDDRDYIFLWECLIYHSLSFKFLLRFLGPRIKY